MADKEYNRLAGIKYRSTQKGKGNILLRHAKNRSLKKNLDFNLDQDWLNEKLNYGKCVLSNISFNFSVKEDLHFNPFAPSIDRIDPKKGYTKDNCRIILVCLNLALGQWGMNTYLQVAKAVIDTQNE